MLTEGLLICSLNETIAFDLFDLVLNLMLQAVFKVFTAHEYPKVFVVAFCLNDKPLV